jgi:hypothetical protein
MKWIMKIDVGLITRVALQNFFRARYTPGFSLRV